jgi:uncharacterized protein with PIN domain
MMDQIRFHLDENVDPAIANGLRRRGLDASTSQETGLLEAPDEEQLAYALNEGRVLVTHDEDFLTMAKLGVKHAGIAYCHSELRSIGQIISGLLLIYEYMTPDDMRNHVEFL